MIKEIENKLTERLLNGSETKLISLAGDAAVRKNALEHFRRMGVPSKRHEDYKYINPEGLFRIGEFMANAKPVRPVTSHDVEELTIAPGAAKVVIVNGVFIPELSKLDRLPAGVTVKSISDAIVSDTVARNYYSTLANASADAFIAWNTALNEGGVFIHIAKSASCDIPVHVVHIASNEAASTFHPRNLIVAENNSSLNVIESFDSIGPVKTLTNAVTEVMVHEGAKLNHYRIQTEGETAHQMNTTCAVAESGSNYCTYTFSLGGGWVRNNLNISFTQEHTEAHLYGLYVTNGNRVLDNHTIVDHAVPNCMSNELYKGVVDGKSTAVFNGKIFVRRDAQKTNAYQTNRNILMSDDASVNTKPQLEIYADDVKCSHGTSTGRLDEDALFYLRARGVGAESARKMLVRAFADEVVNNVPDEAIVAFLDNRLNHLMS
jgi:Fe-S cluster assembly protein SufD